MPITNTTQKDLKYELASQQKTSLNQTNDYLDVQVYVQIRVIRHSLQTQSSRHFQIRTKHSHFSAESERTIIANHFEIRLISLAVTVNDNPHIDYSSFLELPSPGTEPKK